MNWEYTPIVKDLKPGDVFEILATRLELWSYCVHPGGRYIITAVENKNSGPHCSFIDDNGDTMRWTLGGDIMIKVL